MKEIHISEIHHILHNRTNCVGVDCNDESCELSKGNICLKDELEDWFDDNGFTVKA